MSTSASHTLTFSRLRANFTVDKELIGKQDPYCLFQSGHAKVQTKAIKGVGTGTAEWKESYTLEKFSPSTSSIIEVTVYNHNTLLPDSVIGSGTVDLSRQGSESLSGSGEPISVVLTDKKGQEVGSLSFVTNGGGYTGRGTGSGTGVGSGVGTGTGAGLGAGAVGAGAGHSGTVVGKGTGSDQRTAQVASDAAARQGHDVTIENSRGVGVGHPVGSGTHGSGVTSGSTGTGVTSGSTGTGVTSGTATRGTTGTGVATGVAGAGVSDRAYGTKEGEVIDKKYYVGKEGRAQDQALIEQYREHNPYAKDYETTVQHTGRERLVGSQIEALGTRERVIGQDHQVQSHPHAEIARNLPVGAMDARPGGEGWVQTKPGPVCDTNTFSITGDRIVDKERVTDLREHREFEKEFEVKTRLVGERALDAGREVPTTGGKGGKSPKGSPKGKVLATGDKAVESNISGAKALGGNAEILNRERVLVDEKNKNACEGHPEVGAVGGPTLASQGVGTGTGAGYGSSTGTGYGSGVGTGTGTGAGYGTGTGTGTGTGAGTGQRSTLGEKAAGFIPGSEENKDKKQGYAPGQGPDSTVGNRTAGEKAAAFIPGSTENQQKKAGYSS